MARKNIDRQALRQQIQELDIDSELKSQLLQAVSEQKRYGLVWEDHKEEAEDLLKEKIPVLIEDERKRLTNGGDGAPNHILIEGDNLHALTALTYTHEGMVDVIYIDPPYNRGENDFKYNDRYIDKDNPFKHSLWLDFIKKRLLIAKKLLSNKGVIIVHIDEHEFDALHLLLETEVFSQSNNLGLIVWNKLNPKGDAHNVAVMHEYILIFCKNKEFFIASENSLMRDKPNAQVIINKAKLLWGKLGNKSVPDDVKQLLKSYGFEKKVINDLKIDFTPLFIRTTFQNWLSKSNFSKGEKAYKYLDQHGEVFRTVSMAWPNKEVAPDDYWIPLRHPITGETCPLPSKGWRNPSSTMKRLLGEESPIVYDEKFVVKGEIVFTRKTNGKLNIPERVYYLKDNMMENVSSVYNDGSSDEQLLLDLNIQFPYPKCLSIAKYLLKNVQREASVILDFFAGSGTTLHATMQLNAEDGGHRKCILVTNNENNICEEVTYERNKRVINGYTTPKGVEVEGLHDNNLRYYKVDFTEREDTSANRLKLMRLATDMLCIQNDIYDEQEMFGTLQFKSRFVRYFTNKEKQMLVVYEPRAIEHIAKELRNNPNLATKERKLIIYAYSDGGYAYTDEFEGLLDKVELIAMPDALNKALRNVLPAPLLSPEGEDDMPLGDSIANENTNQNTSPSGRIGGTSL